LPLHDGGLSPSVVENRPTISGPQQQHATEVREWRSATLDFDANTIGGDSS